MHHYFAIHKPIGFLSQFKNNAKRKKKLLQELYEFPKGTMAVGRLDANSEGLLLLTTDGKWSNYLRSKHFTKTYYAEVAGIPNSQAIQFLKNGVYISIEGKKYLTQKADAELIDTPQLTFIESKEVRSKNHGPTSWIKINLSEGKFRQVRKMTAAVGHPTLRLIRMQIGNISLDPLKKGETRILSSSELIEINQYLKRVSSL